MRFLRELVDEHDFGVIIATHSTAIVGACESFPHARVGLMKPGQSNIDFHQIDETYRRVLPIFGAHPLSNVFNRKPILLVEGEDDERIWQQAIRSSHSTLRLYPCAVESISQLSMHEEAAKGILSAVYENARGYSLRDGDDKAGHDISDDPPM